MDEDLGVKAPVTRLRRRLSVEAEDSGALPTTPGTPTKKRATRLAAKPQLELINELGTEDVPKRATRKTLAKDAVENQEPSAAVTPARRSARVRSNTSLLGETTINVESPRAKRALRRNSQLGSDTETNLTPARQTRRTRKDSTTSLDKQANTTLQNVVTSTTDADSLTKPKDTSTENASQAKRKSPRLNKKEVKDNEEKKIDLTQTEDNSETPNKPKEHVVEPKHSPVKINGIELNRDNKLVQPSVVLLNKITVVNKNLGYLNKSTSAIDKIADELRDRKRTKSWSTISSISSPTSNAAFLNDIENGKVIIKKKTRNSNIGSGDGLLSNDGNKSTLNSKDVMSPNISMNKSKSQICVANKENIVVPNALFQDFESDINKGTTVKVFEDQPSNFIPTVFIEDSDSNSVGKLSIDTQVDGKVYTFPDGNPSNASPIKGNLSVEPMDIDETIPTNVTINDFIDKSNSTEESEVPKNKSALDEKNISKDESLYNSKRKSSMSIQSATCNSKEVPIGEFVNENNPKNSTHENLVANSEEKSNRSASFSFQIADEKDGNESIKPFKSRQRKSVSENNHISIENARNVSCKSKRNSSISENLEKTSNENKSTLVISQLKDVSANCATSPNLSNKEIFMNGPGIKNKEIDKKNLSLAYLTSTPIQQKSLQKLAIEINTSSISPTVERNDTPKKHISKAPSDSDLLDDKSNNKRKESFVAQRKNVSKPLNSSDSDDESELESESNKMKKTTKKPSIKKSSSEYSDSSDEELETNQKSKNKKAVKKTPDEKTLKSSDSDVSDTSIEGIMKDIQKNKLIVEEASEASDDYDSGDSRNDEERRYEAENEILEKGETLDSEEDLSNDSDYEKDSFIVSSDAEDNEMLSGTGDDLSMSDNELSMSQKSKKKFNERKLKQQKKASKEMYESRHKINESANSSKSEKTKSKKSNRQRLDSSVLESDNENTETKKNNRLRIDSSQDISMTKSEENDSAIVKRKPKRLSESVCEDVNEKEITMCSQSITEKNDPLSVAIKKEPKTPQKPINMSTIAINDNIEEVKVDPNASSMLQEDDLDPLQATMAQDEDSSSDDMEIIQNYDSILNNLNKQTKKIKTIDTSLNINKKVKTSKNPVIDELNLTVTQISKPQKNKHEFQLDSTSKKEEDEETSDSIDMKLLFPENSNDSIPASQLKPKNGDPAEDFISVNKTDAQTNIPGKMGASLNESELNTSKKKNKARKSSQCATEDNKPVDNEDADSCFQFIIDTVGSHEDTPAQKSAKKKNREYLNNEEAIDCTDSTEVPATMPKENENKSFQAAVNDEVILGNKSENKKSRKRSENADFTIVEDTLDISVTSDKKNNKNVSVSEPYVEELNISIKSDKNISMCEPPVEELNISVKSDKKKKKKISISEPHMEELNISVKSDKKKNKNVSISEPPVEELNISVKSDKKKKNNVSISEPHVGELNISVKSDKKKNKNVSISEPDVEELNISVKSDKKKNNNISISEHAVEGLNISVKSDKKKKKNKNTCLNIEPIEGDLDIKSENTSTVDIYTLTQNAEECAAETVKSDKKKKKDKHNLAKSQIAMDNTEYESDEAPTEMSYRSERKTEDTDARADDSMTTSSKKKKNKKNKKKKNKSLDQSQTAETKDDKVTTQEDDCRSQKKRKRKVSNTVAEGVENSISVIISNEKKKRKILEDEYVAAYKDSNVDQSDEEGITKKSKKNKKAKNVVVEDNGPQFSKKRKHSDDNNAVSSKVFKQDLFDNVNVARLPESLLKQLGERPKEKNSKKKAAVSISTLPFEVEDIRRKNKPSNYLEQSVYLNDSPSKDKKRSSKHKIPKVLPFIPTALTSDSGYTSKFNISVLPNETQFVAQASNVKSFKESRLNNNRIKKMGSLERCKFQRSHKISKF